MAKIMLAPPRYADRRHRYLGLEWDGRKLKTVRGVRQEIEPILRAVRLEREVVAARPNALYRPLVKMPEARVLQWLKEQGKTMRDLYRDSDLKEKYRKWALSPENKHLRVS